MAIDYTTAAARRPFALQRGSSVSAKSQDESGDAAGAMPVRLDVWLWASRMFKTRALAKTAIEASRVRVGGATAKPSRSVRIGDAVEVQRGEERFDLEVLGLSERRGSAPEARRLYRESPESVERRASELAARRAERAGYSAPESKPDKRARKLIRALGDIELM